MPVIQRFRIEILVTSKKAVSTNDFKPVLQQTFDHGMGWLSGTWKQVLVGPVEEVPVEGNNPKVYVNVEGSVKHKEDESGTAG